MPAILNQPKGKNATNHNRNRNKPTTDRNRNKQECLPLSVTFTLVTNLPK